jgi:Ca2+:H+ antiporter
VAWLLLLDYGLTLVFSLRTHRSLYEVAQLDLAAEIVAAETAEAPGVAGLEIAGLQTAGAELAGPEIAEAPGGHGHRPPLLPWFLVLLGATAGIAYESEMFVGVVETVSEGFGLSGLFTGVVLLPLLGGVAEYITAVGMARRNKMDLAVSVALGSTLLVALLVVPVLVLVGPALGHPLDLSFNPYELVAIATAVVVSNLASLDGRSDWLEGVLLLAAYVILAAGFFFQSTPIG